MRKFEPHFLERLLEGYDWIAKAEAMEQAWGEGRIAHRECGVNLGEALRWNEKAQKEGISPVRAYNTALMAKLNAVQAFAIEYPEEFAFMATYLFAETVETVVPSEDIDAVMRGIDFDGEKARQALDAYLIQYEMTGESGFGAIQDHFKLAFNDASIASVKEMVADYQHLTRAQHEYQSGSYEGLISAAIHAVEGVTGKIAGLGYSASKTKEIQEKVSNEIISFLGEHTGGPYARVMQQLYGRLDTILSDDPVNTKGNNTLRMVTRDNGNFGSAQFEYSDWLDYYPMLDFDNAGEVMAYWQGGGGDGKVLPPKPPPVAYVVPGAYGIWEYGGRIASIRKSETEEHPYTIEEFEAVAGGDAVIHNGSKGERPVNTVVAVLHYNSSSSFRELDFTVRDMDKALSRDEIGGAIMAGAYLDGRAGQWNEALRASGGDRQAANRVMEKEGYPDEGELIITPRTRYGNDICTAEYEWVNPHALPLAESILNMISMTEPDGSIMMTECGGKACRVFRPDAPFILSEIVIDGFSQAAAIVNAAINIVEDRLNEGAVYYREHAVPAEKLLRPRENDESNIPLGERWVGNMFFRSVMGVGELTCHATMLNVFAKNDVVANFHTSGSAHKRYEKQGRDNIFSIDFTRSQDIVIEGKPVHADFGHFPGQFYAALKKLNGYLVDNIPSAWEDGSYAQGHRKVGLSSLSRQIHRQVKNNAFEICQDEQQYLREAVEVGAYALEHSVVEDMPEVKF